MNDCADLLEGVPFEADAEADATVGVDNPTPTPTPTPTPVPTHPAAATVAAAASPPATPATPALADAGRSPELRLHDIGDENTAAIVAALNIMREVNDSQVAMSARLLELSQALEGRMRQTAQGVVDEARSATRSIIDEAALAGAQAAEELAKREHTKAVLSALVDAGFSTAIERLNGALTAAETATVRLNAATEAATVRLNAATEAATARLNAAAEATAARAQSTQAAAAATRPVVPASNPRAPAAPSLWDRVRHQAGAPGWWLLGAMLLSLLALKVL